MAALLSITNQPLATLSNSTAAAETNRDSASPWPSEPEVTEIPHFITISNSPAVVTRSESGFTVLTTRTISPGPLLWLTLVVLTASLLIVIWFSLRGRRR